MIELRNRSTADLVIIALTAVVCFTVVVSIMGIFAINLIHPNLDISSLTQRIGTIVSQVIGVIVGYIAGRGNQTPRE